MLHLIYTQTVWLRLFVCFHLSFNVTQWSSSARNALRQNTSVDCIISIYYVIPNDMCIDDFSNHVSSFNNQYAEFFTWFQFFAWTWPFQWLWVQLLLSYQLSVLHFWSANDLMIKWLKTRVKMPAASAFRSLSVFEWRVLIFSYFLRRGLENSLLC